MKQLIRKVVNGENLSKEEMMSIMSEILSGELTPAQTGAFITALKIKGETTDEIVGACMALRKRNPVININNHLVSIARDEINVEEETILSAYDPNGKGTRTFNVSTATALVAAGGGAKVVKHGFGAISTKCGSSDVLHCLGVKLDINHSNMVYCIENLGIGFFYAPFYQSPMRHVAKPRMEIGIRSIFNLVGPLSNPADAHTQFLGVYNPDLTEKMASVLDALDIEEAFVVSGEVTMDEISVCGKTIISHLQGGKIKTFEITPEQYGFKRATPESIKGGNAVENARIIRSILEGEIGPRRDLVVLNAAAVFVLNGMDNDMESGIERAKESLDSGRAKEKLEELIKFTQDCGPFVRKEIGRTMAG